MADPYNQPTRVTRGPTKRSMATRMIIMLVIVGIVFALIFGFEAFRGMMIKKFMSGMKDPLQTVATTVATAQDWQSKLEAVGSLRAVNGADLSLETSGIVDQLAFNSGDDVKAGTVLLHLRLDDDQAKLDALKATAELAQITYDRDEKQLKVQAIAQATLDSDSANLKNAKAQVAQQQALIDKKTLKAPFSGHLGIRNVDLGQYLNAGTAVVTLQALDPIYADFYLPQQALQQLQLNQPVTIKIDTYPGETFTGTISAINPKVDSDSRNIQVRATIKNADHRLLPGMYATIGIDTGAPQPYLTLPQTAISFNPYGNTVYLVDDKGKDDKGQEQLIAHQTFVTTGATRGDQIQILKGVNEGDTVVAAGQNKLHNGTRLKVDNSVLTPDAAAPSVQDH